MQRARPCRLVPTRDDSKRRDSFLAVRSIGRENHAVHVRFGVAHHLLSEAIGQSDYEAIFRVFSDWLPPPQLCRFALLFLSRLLWGRSFRSSDPLEPVWAAVH